MKPQFKAFRLPLILAALSAIVISTNALAAKKSAEKYSATDNTGSAIVSDDEDGGSDQVTDHQEPIAPIPAPAQTQAAVAAPAPVAKSVFIQKGQQGQQAPSPTPTSVAETTATAVAPAPKQTTAAVEAVAKPAFDRVPRDQVEPILERLQLVQEIIRRYGRAYDYRIYTVRELETVLNNLKAASLEAKR